MLIKYYQVVDSNGEKQFVNPVTGELLEVRGSVYIETAEQRQQRREYFRKQQEAQIEHQRIESQYVEYGNFIWYFYRINQVNFSNLSESYLVRLIYLASYVDYQGVLKKNRNTVLRKVDLPKILDISDREAIRFLNKIQQENIVLIQNMNGKESICLNRDLFFKGKLSREFLQMIAMSDKDIMRLYIDGIRNVYLRTIPTSRKKLGYIFKLIPYINKKYNIVCHNPNETERTQIKPMSFGEICTLIGYNKNQEKRLLKDLLKIQFTSEGQTYSIIQYLVYSTSSGTQTMTLVNPKIYYAGHDWEVVAVLATNEFKITQ